MTPTCIEIGLLHRGILIGPSKTRPGRMIVQDERGLQYSITAAQMVTNESVPLTGAAGKEKKVSTTTTEAEARFVAQITGASSSSSSMPTRSSRIVELPTKQKAVDSEPIRNAVSRSNNPDTSTSTWSNHGSGSSSQWEWRNWKGGSWKQGNQWIAGPSDPGSESAEKKRQRMTSLLGGKANVFFFDWAEPQEHGTVSSRTESPNSAGQSNPQAALCTQHCSTGIDGCEGLLVDTGAVDNLTGLDFVVRQHQTVVKYGSKVNGVPLPNPEGVSGVGGRVVQCTERADIPGALEDGRLISYAAPVIPGKTSPVSPLYGLNSMAKLNTYFGTQWDDGWDRWTELIKKSFTIESEREESPDITCRLCGRDLNRSINSSCLKKKVKISSGVQGGEQSSKR